MSIISPTNFNIQASEPIDARYQHADITARNNIAAPTRYWGMIAHVLDSDGSNNPDTYILTKGYADTDISNNSNWRALAKSSNGSATVRTMQFGQTNGNFYGQTSIRQLNYSDTGIAIGSTSDSFYRLEIDQDTIRTYKPTPGDTNWELGTNGSGGSKLILSNLAADTIFELEADNSGSIRMQAGGLPTTQPGTSGEVWLDNGVLTIGAGGGGGGWALTGTTTLTGTVDVNPDGNILRMGNTSGNKANIEINDTTGQLILKSNGTGKVYVSGFTAGATLINGDLSPYTGNSGSLATTTQRWGTIFSRALNSDTIVIDGTFSDSAVDEYAVFANVSLADFVAEAGTQTFTLYKGDIDSNTTGATGWDEIYLMDLQYDTASKFKVTLGEVVVPSGDSASRDNNLGAIRHNTDNDQFEIRGSLLNQSSSYSRIGEHTHEMTISGEGTVLQNSTNTQSFNLSPFKSADGTVELRLRFIAYDSGNDLGFTGEYVALYKDLTSTATQIGSQVEIYSITDDAGNPPVITLDASGGSARITVDFANTTTPTRSYDFYYEGIFRYNNIKASA